MSSTKKQLKFEAYKCLDGINISINGVSYYLSQELPLIERVVTLIYWGVDDSTIFSLITESKNDIFNVLQFFGSIRNARFLFSFLSKDLKDYTEINSRLQEFITFLRTCNLTELEVSKWTKRSIEDVHKLLSFLQIKTGMKHLEKSKKNNVNAKKESKTNNTAKSKQIFNETSIAISSAVEKSVLLELGDVALSNKNKNKTQSVVQKEEKLKKLQQIQFIGELFGVTHKECEEITNNLGQVNWDKYNPNFKYVVSCILGVFVYGSPFYPIEDRILKEFYVDLGDSILDLLNCILPEFVVHTASEYQKRVIELGVKTPHPSKNFALSEENRAYIHYLGTHFKVISPKYVPWMDSFDLAIYCDMLGYRCVKSTKNKDEDYIKDLSPYISKAKKFKECVYHNAVWTSEKHTYLESHFKQQGFSVLNCEILKSISFDLCKERVKQFKFKQNYTVDEVQNMKLVYRKKGFAGLVSAFPYRSEDALRYKVREQGWDIANISSDALQEKVDALFETKKSLYYREIENAIYEKATSEVLETMTEQYKSQISLGLEQSLAEKVEDGLKKIFDSDFSDYLKSSIKEMLLGCNLKQLVFECPTKITDFIYNAVKVEIQNLSI